jgi:hypothetical protein
MAWDPAPRVLVSASRRRSGRYDGPWSAGREGGSTAYGQSAGRGTGTACRSPTGDTNISSHPGSPYSRFVTTPLGGDASGWPKPESGPVETTRTWLTCQWERSVKWPHRDQEASIAQLDPAEGHARRQPAIGAGRASTTGSGHQARVQRDAGRFPDPGPWRTLDLGATARAWTSDLARCPKSPKSRFGRTTAGCCDHRGHRTRPSAGPTTR